MRDKKGRFKKQDEEDEITLKITLPSLKKIFYFVLLVAILLPWIIIGNKFNIFKRINDFIERLMTSTNEDGETPKKNGLFY